MFFRPYFGIIVTGLAIAAAANSYATPVVPCAPSLPANTWIASPARPLDPSIERFVDGVLGEMTVEEKVAQMIQADIASISPAEVAQYRLGSILAGGNAAPGNDIRTTPQAWLDLTRAFHAASLLEKANGHRAIPILFGIDAVHGNAKVIGATIFPHNVGLGAAHDADLVRRIGAATAEEVSAIGVDWTFAPTVAVARDVRWGRSYESYSEAPELIAQYAPAMVEGLQGSRDSNQFLGAGHTLANVKHFLGDGGTLDGRDQGDTQVCEPQLAQIHGAGYSPAIAAGALIVMASYNSWNGVKLHASHYLLTEVLKGRLAFQGFVVGDWNAHEQIPACTKSNCAAAILAGIDMLMAPDAWKAIFTNTVSQVRNGDIPMQRIDDAVRRILRVKTIAGAFNRAPQPEQGAAGLFTGLGSEAHRTLARVAVRESLVLLKNSSGALPLKPKARVLVCGEGADDIGAQSGGWTIDWQGDHNHKTDFPGATSIFEALHAQAAAAGGVATLSGDCSFAAKPDVAVVVYGESPYAEFQGDLETLQFSPGDKHTLTTLRRLRQAGIPTVSVFLSGRPRWVNPEINASDAFIAAWLPGSEGQGVSDLLYGRADDKPVDFTGRLSFSWPETAMPVTFSQDGRVSGTVFARGYGLSYAHPANTGRLSEDPKILAKNHYPDGSLFYGSHVTAPWSIFLADGGEQVHKTTVEQASPNAAVIAKSTSEGIEVRWTGVEAGIFEISGRARSLLKESAQGESLTFRYRIDATADQKIALAMYCTESTCGSSRGAQLDVTDLLRASPIGQWRTLRVPVSCFAATGAQLAAVEVPFALRTAGHLQLTISDLRLDSVPIRSSRDCPLPL